MEQSLEADMYMNYITSPAHTIPIMQYNDLGLEAERKIDEFNFKIVCRSTNTGTYVYGESLLWTSFHQSLRPGAAPG